VAPPRKQAENGENKHFPAALGGFCLLEKKTAFLPLPFILFPLTVYLHSTFVIRHSIESKKATVFSAATDMGYQDFNLWGFIRSSQIRSWDSGFLDESCINGGYLWR